MISTQQLFFPWIDLELERVRDEVRTATPSQDAHDDLLKKIRAAISRTRGGGMVMVGCSAAADQGRIIDDLPKANRSTADPKEASGPPVVRFAMPPMVTNPRDQVNLLFERYENGTHTLHLAYRHHPQFDVLRAALGRRTPTEEIIDTLAGHGVGMVCITDAHIMAAGAKRVADASRLFRHLHDIARGSNVPHVLFGEMDSIWFVANRDRLASEIELVMQTMYNPPDKGDQGRFVAILKKYDGFIKQCSAMKLETHYRSILPRVAGDPYRFAAWLDRALCEASSQGVSKLEWDHLKCTAPRLEQVNDAGRALNAYLMHKRQTSFELTGAALHLVADKGSSQKPKGQKGKHIGRKPGRDMVSKVA